MTDKLRTTDDDVEWVKAYQADAEARIEAREQRLKRKLGPMERSWILREARDDAQRRDRMGRS